MCQAKCAGLLGIHATTVRELCRSAQLVQPPCRGTVPSAYCGRARDGQSAALRGGNDIAGAFLLVVGRDAYADLRPAGVGALTIGRGETNAVRVDDPLASRAHACLHVGEAMHLEDVGSVNGTRVKDRSSNRRAGADHHRRDDPDRLDGADRSAAAAQARSDPTRDAARRGAADHPGRRRRRRARARRCAGCTTWRSGPPPARSTSWSRARRASARSCSPRRCTALHRGAAVPTSASTARRCRKRCWCAPRCAGRRR